jgi:phage tail sheath gpL-like
VSISFDEIQPDILTPIFILEINNRAAAAGPVILSYRALLIGQKLAAGTAVANTRYLVTSADQVATLAGRGSILHGMAVKWFAINRQTEVWILPVADDGAGVAAVGDITFTGPATASGTVRLRLGGVAVNVAVTSGDTAAEIATAAVAAINAKTDIPVTAAVNGVDTTQVDITFRHKGEVGNDFDIRYNYREGEELPAGVTATVTAMAGGATNPDCTAALAALGDNWHHVWAHPWRDTDNLVALETELARRWDANVALRAVAIGGCKGTLGAMTTLGDARNSEHSCLVAPESSDPLAPPWEYAAATAARAALSGAIQPNQPLQTLELGLPIGKVPWTREERQVLLQHGIATTRVGPGDALQIDRVVTTYKTNAAGSPDSSYRDVTVMLTLLYLAYSWNARLAQKYPRALVAGDTIVPPPGAQVMTPAVGKAEAIGWFLEMQSRLLVQDVEQFKTDLVVQQNGPNRMEWLLPPKLIEGLIVGATQLQFRRAS